MGIPIVGIVDTNCNPEGIDYVIPGNDDASRSIFLFTRAASDACLEGSELATGLKTEPEKSSGPTIKRKQDLKPEENKKEEAKKPGSKGTKQKIKETNPETSILKAVKSKENLPVEEELKSTTQEKKTKSKKLSKKEEKKG